MAFDLKISAEVERRHTYFCYCDEPTKYKLTDVQKALFDVECNTRSKNQTLLLALIFVVPVVISFVSVISKFFLRKVTTYERQISFETEITSRVVKMTLFSFVAIGIIVTANSINKSFYNLPAIVFNKISPEVFTEFSVEWYRRSSFSVTLTIVF